MSTSWRDILPVHPAADLFPMMTPDEITALGEDIKNNDAWLHLRPSSEVSTKQRAILDELIGEVL
jgi:hypothetical protein